MVLKQISSLIRAFDSQRGETKEDGKSDMYTYEIYLKDIA